MNKEEFLFQLANVYEGCLETAKRKNADYTGGDADNPLKNFKRCHNIDLTTVEGIMVRLGDKIARIEGLVKGHQAQVKDEALKDTVLDAINYLAIMAVVIDSEEKEKENVCTE